MDLLFWLAGAKLNFLLFKSCKSSFLCGDVLNGGKNHNNGKLNKQLECLAGVKRVISEKWFFGFFAICCFELVTLKKDSHFIL